MENCKECNIDKGKKMCSVCEDSFYLFIDSDNNKICNSCEIGENEKCKTCGKIPGTCDSCNELYNLSEDGKCAKTKKIDNSIFVTYKASATNRYVKLLPITCEGGAFEMDYRNVQFFLNETQLKTTYISVLDCSSCEQYDFYFGYKFDTVGLYTVKIVLKSVKSLSNYFRYCDEIVSVKFSPYFDSSNLYDMSLLFWYCENLVDVDMSSLNTSHVTDISFMFMGAKSIKRLDLSNFDTRKLQCAIRVFDYNNDLEYLDFSSWNTSVTNTVGSCSATTIFGYNLPNGITIKISNKYTKNRWNMAIPLTWTVINIDES